jgi:hypothetical protein
MDPDGFGRWIPAQVIAEACPSQVDVNYSTIAEALDLDHSSAACMAIQRVIGEPFLDVEDDLVFTELKIPSPETRDRLRLGCHATGIIYEDDVAKGTGLYASFRGLPFVLSCNDVLGPSRSVHKYTFKITLPDDLHGEHATQNLDSSEFFRPDTADLLGNNWVLAGLPLWFPRSIQPVMFAAPTEEIKEAFEIKVRVKQWAFIPHFPDLSTVFDQWPFMRLILPRIYSSRKSTHRRIALAAMTTNGDHSFKYTAFNCPGGLGAPIFNHQGEFIGVNCQVARVTGYGENTALAASYIYSRCITMIATRSTSPPKLLLPPRDEHDEDDDDENDGKAMMDTSSDSRHAWVSWVTEALMTGSYAQPRLGAYETAKRDDAGDKEVVTEIAIVANWRPSLSTLTWPAIRSEFPKGSHEINWSSFRQRYGDIWALSMADALMVGYFLFLLLLDNTCGEHKIIGQFIGSFFFFFWFSS